MRQATRSTTYRAAAIERLKDARILLEGKRPSGAIYLGGYAVESMFKYYLCQQGRTQYLEDLPNKRLVERVLSAKGHDLEVLLDESGSRELLRNRAELQRQFNHLTSWSVNLRYKGEVGDVKIATQFLAAADAIVQWLESRGTQ